MAAPSSKAEPYKWDESVVLPPEAIEVWKEVAESVERGEGVPLASLVRAMQFANEHFQSQKRAREFVDQHTLQIIIIILTQECSKEDSIEYILVEECLKLSAIIIAKDIDIQLKRKGDLSKSMPVLAMLLIRGFKYYKSTDGKKTRVRVIDTFQTEGGFSRLAQYLSRSKFPPSSPVLEFLFGVFHGVYDLIEIKRDKPDLKTMNELTDLLDKSDSTTNVAPLFLDKVETKFQNLIDGLRSSESNRTEPVGSMPAFSSSLDQRKEDALLIANAVLGFIRTLSLERLQEEWPRKAFGHVIQSLGAVLDLSTRNDVSEYNQVVRDLTLRLIKSQNAELRTFGWEQTSLLVIRAMKHRPPARTVTVSNSGRSFLEGTYSFVGRIGEDGYAEPDSIFYERKVPSNAKEAAGRTFYIHPAKSTSTSYKWHLSLKNTDEPSVYCVAESIDGHQPPEAGWTSNCLVGSPPALQCQGLIAPVGEEWNTLEHQLVAWTIDNRVIELFYGDVKNCESVIGSTSMTLLIKLLAFMSKRSAPIGNREQIGEHNEYRLHSSHVLLAWNGYICCEDEHVSLAMGDQLTSIFHYLPEDVALCLLGAMRECLVSDLDKVAGFCIMLVCVSVELETAQVDLALGSPFGSLSVSEDVRIEMKKIMWSIRTRRDVDFTEEFYEEWLKLETFRRSDGNARQNRAQAELLGANVAPPKPMVSLVDPEARRIQVSMPVESPSGEYYVGMHVLASCDDGHEGAELTIASVGRDAIEQCLNDCSDTVTVQANLPTSGIWSVDWCGLLLRKDKVETPRSGKAIIDFTAHETEQQKQKRAEVDAMNELARQHAGDIQGTIRKLRGPCSGQMEVDFRFSLLHTAVVRGRLMLKKLKCLVETNGCEEASGIAALTDALGQAHLPMAELEAAVKAHNKKDRAKSFKAHVTSLLENEEVASWLESVDTSDLESLGGDSNRLYQLLVESKGSKLSPRALDALTLKAASARADLFSKKQIKTLTKLQAKARILEESKSGMACKNGVKPVPLFENESERMADSPPDAIQVASTVVASQELVKDITNTTLIEPTSHTSDDFLLLTFLKEQKECLKGSPECFCRWLVDSEDIVSLDDLATAVSNDEYLQGVLKQGDGINGVKGFQRAAFKKAVLVAADRDRSDATTLGTQEDKENIQPPSVLMCPISRVLMTKEPVLAADGNTYELAAIADWFDKQNADIVAAKQQLAAGKHSKQLQAIVERGIVSPMTGEQIENLSLTSNELVRTMARDAAKAAKKKVPFGKLSS